MDVDIVFKKFNEINIFLIKISSKFMIQKFFENFMKRTFLKIEFSY